MKQVLQDLKTGEIIVTEVPDPIPAPGRVLVRVEVSLLSAGTESAMIAKGQQSLLSKILEKPELLRRGFEEFRERGIAGIKERLASKFGGFTELGYSCMGTVVDGGNEEIEPGRRVACAGAGLANHAELISVPRLLVAAVPDGVTSESAAYTTVGAIALHGIRQGQLQLGENVAIVGLGLVGLLAAQFARVAGCKVLGIDPSVSAQKRGLAIGCDAVASPDHAEQTILSLSQGLGADAVIICAATADSSPLEMAGRLARSRGRIVMVGATGMTIPRQEYFLKELSLVLSRSYGPGRYDRSYEEEGHDYPLDYVRFTEQRNMQSFLDLAKKGQVDTARLTTHRFPLEQAPAAYTLLNDRSVDRVGVLLTYSNSTPRTPKFSLQISANPAIAGENALGIGFIGAGNYAQTILLPLLSRMSGLALKCVMTRTGSHALQVARRFGFETVCTRAEEVLENPGVGLVFIATRHDTHADLAAQALRAGKHVWVEKPLALSIGELKKVWQAAREHPQSKLVVGFNRPFSRPASWLLARIPTGNPRMMCYRVNAGKIAPDSWVHDPRVGGGRLLGEGCHFFDFLRHAAGAPGDMVSTQAARSGRADLPDTANFAVTIRFCNGSIGQLLYSSDGALKMGKERFECFSAQVCGVLDDYRRAEFFGNEKHEKHSQPRQDKGQGNLLTLFLESLRAGGSSPMSVEDVFESSLLTLAAQQSLALGQPVQMNDLRTQII